jgi:hypothetical protein
MPFRKCKYKERRVTFELFLVALHVMVDSHHLSGFSVDKKVNPDVSDTASSQPSGTCPL